MKNPFFSRRLRFFGSVAMLILCVVFFLVPFMGRGAKMAVQNMKNDVADWLPSHFDETKDYEWFITLFWGEAYVVVTWPGCNEDSPTYQLYLEKLQAEVMPPPDEDIRGLSPEEQEIRRARQIGDELGLHLGSDFRENSGERGEKWLRGFGGQPYFITPDGKLYRWNGQNTTIAAVGRSVRELVTGSNRATGDFVAQIGSPPQPGKPNAFHEDPRKLTARLLKSVTTGPEVLEQLAGENGTLALSDDEESIQQARKLAFDRLTGILFGTQPPRGFHWRREDLRKVLPQAKIEELQTANPDWESAFDQFVSQLVEKQYDGEIEKLIEASAKTQAQHWQALFAELGVEPPARQTCIMVSFSNVGLKDFSLCVGRELMGKPKGLLLRLAEECGIPTELTGDPSEDEKLLKLGGPPVDNVAIDEEGKITLFRLAFYSGIIGMSLAVLCFRSIKVALMVFFVGGVAAAMSLAIVYWSGTATDSIVMSMPALVYVLGLSGSVHIVNYYRDAVRKDGLHGAPETAVSHGWFPCSLAATTTAIGLMSLYIGSGVVPIKKFGLFSALGVMATLILLFTYLPSALHVWNPGYHKRRGERGNRPGGMAHLISGFWRVVGGWIVRKHWWVTSAGTIIVVVFAIGLTQINTSVHLLKLFHSEAKIIKDYTWIEENLSYLVPMEILIDVDKDALLPPLEELAKRAPEQRDNNKENLQYNFLERAELANRVHRYLEEAFGSEGQQILGRGLSSPQFLPPFPDPNGATISSPRFAYNSTLEEFRDDLLKEDYLRIDPETGDEIWRVSLRVAALSDVDYGVFVNELKRVVEPIASAYRVRNKALRGIARPEQGIRNSTVLVLGTDPRSFGDEPLVQAVTAGRTQTFSVDHTRIFAETFDDLLRNKGFRRPSRRREYDTKLLWHDPDKQPLKEIVPSERDWANVLRRADCVVLLNDHEDYDKDFINQHAKFVVHAQDHGFNPSSDKSLTAKKRKAAGDKDTNITVAYTGSVPIVYKAQRTLLESLINSVGLAFVTIAFVMMLLLRDWRRRPSLKNSLNLPGGLVSMLPNAFPVVIIFGGIGWTSILASNGIWFDRPILVDLGSMMTASVAMGIAVDDTIHFLNWFRSGMRQGLSRKESINLAYDKVGTAMTQTTLIGGLGLAVFYFSTFMPTQAFGIKMLILLVMALVGDLIFLPALLAGPLGKYFEVSAIKSDKKTATDSTDEPSPDSKDRGKTPHSDKASRGSKSPLHIRIDASHESS